MGILAQEPPALYAQAQILRTRTTITMSAENLQDAPAGEFQDNSYVSRSGNKSEPLPVQYATVVQLTQSLLRHCLRLYFDSSSKHLRCRAPPRNSPGESAATSAEQAQKAPVRFIHQSVTMLRIYLRYSK